MAAKSFTSDIIFSKGAATYDAIKETLKNFKNYNQPITALDRLPDLSFPLIPFLPARPSRIAPLFLPDTWLIQPCTRGGLCQNC